MYTQYAKHAMQYVIFYIQEPSARVGLQKIRISLKNWTYNLTKIEDLNYVFKCIKQLELPLYVCTIKFLLSYINSIIYACTFSYYLLPAFHIYGTCLA